MALLTDWFPKKIKPAYEGYYEVMFKSWPWSELVEWTDEYGWIVDNGVEVTTWRGLATNPDEYITLED